MEECTYHDAWYQDASGGCFAHRGRDALAYIQQLEAQVPKWVSVEERLPELDTVVLACLREPLSRLNAPYQEQIVKAWYRKNIYLGGVVRYEWDRAYGACTFKLDVTHWMPLPELPKEG